MTTDKKKFTPKTATEVMMISDEERRIRFNKNYVLMYEALKYVITYSNDHHVVEEAKKALSAVEGKE